MKESTPLYHQLKSELLAAIQSGHWPEGALLPSEHELSAHFQVSRTTVRLAIGDLVSAGYVVRQQGKGTFVATRSRSYSASRLYGFAEELHQQGQEVNVELDHLEVCACPPLIAEKLHVTSSTQVLSLTRTAYVDNRVPMFVERSYIIAPFHASVAELAAHPEEFDHIYDFLERSGIRIALGSQYIRAEAATPQDIQSLAMSENQPVLVITRITQDESGSPVEYSQVRYPADRYQYEVRLRREEM
ncbi:GntR family transcriptional regulator [Alicyclobacillaceae bacterium I2511]|jgi:GntR family transcriptional regulator|nr:GntR family transcriptional regulator [Alicyclobacillaceae bacterium I2511]